MTRGLLSASRPRTKARALVREILRPVDPDDGFGYVLGLKRDARRKAAALGHTLAPFRERPWTKTILNSNCERCQALVCVNAGDLKLPSIYGDGVKQRCP